LGDIRPDRFNNNWTNTSYGRKKKSWKK